jgi:hypothetical protein
MPGEVIQDGLPPFTLDLRIVVVFRLPHQNSVGNLGELNLDLSTVFPLVGVVPIRRTAKKGCA